MPDIDYSDFSKVSDVAKELEKRQIALHRLCKHQAEVREDKKATAAGFRETLKEIQTKIEEEIAAIDGLNAHRKTLEKKG